MQWSGKGYWDYLMLTLMVTKKAEVLCARLIDCSGSSWEALFDSCLAKQRPPSPFSAIAAKPLVPLIIT